MRIARDDDVVALSFAEMAGKCGISREIVTAK
jgi:hypothetical protein